MMANQRKTINTLIPDIYDLIEVGKTPSKENLDIFCKEVTEALTKALAQGCHSKEANLRMSNMGTPNRKLWYTLKGFKSESLKPAQALSFMYGHLIEQFLLLLAREAGHVVSDEQLEVELDGVKGHIDCKIDGVLIDVKGMSNYGFMKFLTGSVLNKDDYGYIDQISGYAQATDSQAAGFFVFNKERGTMTLFLLEDMDLKNARSRIQEVKGFLVKDTPPQRCYKPVPEGIGGNLVLDKPCEFCPFKSECWKEANNGYGLRKFKYSTGTKYFVRIEKMPRVAEIIDEKEDSEEIIES